MTKITKDDVIKMGKEIKSVLCKAKMYDYSMIVGDQRIYKSYNDNKWHKEIVISFRQMEQKINREE